MKDKNFIKVNSLTGKNGDISVMFLGVTFRVENEKSIRFIDPNFGAWLLEKIYNQNSLFGIRKGFFHKEWFCPSCKTLLKTSKLIQNQFEFTFAYKEYPSFILQLTLPSIICSKCKRIIVIDKDGSLGYRLNEAIIQAFKTKNILP